MWHNQWYLLSLMKQVIKVPADLIRLLRLFFVFPGKLVSILCIGDIPQRLLASLLIKVMEQRFILMNTSHTL